ncbi:ATP-binding protein [Fuscibacter oryzae]|uniref:ATP-binding protein n=1 Tax=Fuscibacter oryzae TaxID=2803939 RepID=A0A8J7MR77_9RHOB|nr:ATP-binding protein [Fuscibacter oryzae]MBL4926828.1 ATP-binding protein [Fuscibacter oryzae]
MIPAQPDAVSLALQRVMRARQLTMLTADGRSTTELVLAEVLNNVVEHAYARYPGEIELRLTVDPACLHCQIIDSGLPMPEERLPAGDPPNLGGDLPEGGFGWNLIRTLTTGLEYHRLAGRNYLQFSLPV